ncbi:hypothetical protein Gotri_002692 [Gossypium trilobum]|uniref:Uncharacterized protein n=1 Tax=Gossypium trilobum TaxID=34281 RepID=A0A7J9F936_9ROSI|nr:hypothetical protein [Gossypium trilobum]
MVIEDALLLIDNGGRTLKKVRRRPDEPLDPDDPIVDDKGMKEEDLELDDRDAKNETIDGIPNITFSDQRRTEVEDFGSWIIVEWKQRRRAQPLEGMNNGKGSDALDGSKFDVVRIE